MYISVLVLIVFDGVVIAIGFLNFFETESKSEQEEAR